MYDIIIIGAGPGGVSSALYSKRANMNVLLLYNGEGELKKAHKIDNYYGFPDGIEGIDLFNNGSLVTKSSKDSFLSTNASLSIKIYLFSSFLNCVLSNILSPSNKKIY